MKNWRDQHAPHRDFQKRDVTRYSVFDLAIASACYYYAQVIAELRKRGIGRYPDDLRAYGDAFLKQSTAIAKRAVAATADIPEKVN